METSEDTTLELITVWDGSWVDKLNEKVTPLLKDIHFGHYKEEFTIEGQVFYGQDLVKVVVNTDSGEYFLNTLKEGDLNQGRLLVRLEGWILRDFGFQLTRRIEPSTPK